MKNIIKALPILLVIAVAAFLIIGKSKDSEIGMDGKEISSEDTGSEKIDEDESEGEDKEESEDKELTLGESGYVTDEGNPENVSDAIITEEMIESDPELKANLERMKEETENPKNIITIDDDNFKTDYNYLENVREIGHFYVLEEAYKGLGEDFNTFVTDKGCKGNVFKIVDGKKVSDGVTFRIVQVDGNMEFDCFYDSKAGEFQFDI